MDRHLSALMKLLRLGGLVIERITFVRGIVKMLGISGILLKNLKTNK